MLDLEVSFAIRGQLPSWLSWESESVLAGIPPVPQDEEPYKESIAVTANYSAFGMSHVIESQLELEITSPGSGVAELASSLRSSVNPHFASGSGGAVDGGIEAYLDDDDDDMMFANSGNPFSSEHNTPPSAITPSLANPNQLLYVPSQSLQSSQLKQTAVGPASHTSVQPLAKVPMNSLTPILSPTSLQFNAHAVGSTSRQSSSAPQTPHGGPPSQPLSLQIPSQPEINLASVSNQQPHFRYTDDNQPNVMYNINQMRLSPPISGESANANRIYGIDEDVAGEHGYFDESYSVELGSPFLGR
jgi:hypothetical protein